MDIRIEFSVVPASTSTAKITGVSAKTGRKIKLSEVIFRADPEFFIEFAEKVLDVLDEAEKTRDYWGLSPAMTAKSAAADAPQDPKVVAEYEEALVQKLRAAIRELFGGPIAAGGQ